MTIWDPQKEGGMVLHEEVIQEVIVSLPHVPGGVVFVRPLTMTTGADETQEMVGAEGMTPEEKTGIRCPPLNVQENELKITDNYYY